MALAVKLHRNREPGSGPSPYRNGLIALQTDGTVRRGLAVFEIQREGPAMIDPAPSSLSAPGI